MMFKSVLVFSIAALCIYTLDASPPTNQHLNLRALLNAKNDPKIGELSSDNKDGLCEPCKKFFDVLKDVIGDVNNLTKDTLTSALNVTCKYLEGSIPFIDQICEEFGPKFIDILYKYLKEVDQEIDPEHDCKLLLLCWGNSKSEKEAFQKMVVENKIRFD